ncbi:MAG: hypothetical protein SFX73_31595 [Kofleriaceae bacterium]|nr:hypothetical protein [Kofleriaceae bacterium]
MPRDPSSPHPDDEQAKDEEEAEVVRAAHEGDQELDDDDLDDLFDLDDLDFDEEEDEGEGPDA